MLSNGQQPWLMAARHLRQQCLQDAHEALICLNLCLLAEEHTREAPQHGQL